MPTIPQASSHGPLRDHLMEQDIGLADAVNNTWNTACDIHERQTEKNGNVNGRKHAEHVEKNIWKLLSKTHANRPGHELNLSRFEAMDIYLLSCVACCHDFDKGLHNEVLGGDFKHGEGSGTFVFDNWQNLGIVSQAAAEHIDWIVSIHDCKRDFDKKLQTLPDLPGLPPLRCLATLLKAADTLHMDESRISRLAVPDDSLTGFDRLKQLARGNIQGWGPDGRSIVVTVSIKDEETSRALQNCAQYVREIEWPPIERNLREHQFPCHIRFEWTCPPHLKPQLVEQGLLGPDRFSANREGITSEHSLPRSTHVDAPVSGEPFKIIAVRPDDLGTYLCEMGHLSVIDNGYVAPQLRDLGAKPGAVSRAFVGPASCGKTRAAYEWIREKIGLNTNAWMILRPESGSIPLDAAKFEIDWRARYGEKRRRPNRAILFVDDLPDFLPPPGTGPAAAEAVHRLFRWFRSHPGWQERCFVGTVRAERMGDKPDWPEKLLELGEDMRLLRVESLDEPKRRQLWQGMGSARVDRPDGIQVLGLQLDEDFIDAVAERDADPETISYFARAMASPGKQRLTVDDAERFSSDVVRIWLKETWPAIHDAYGAVASVFLTLARFIEAGAQDSSRFKGSLPPSWEYHAVYGPALLDEIQQTSDEYIAGISHILMDGHASGVEGEWIRPKFDFLLQAPAMNEVVVPLPSVEWFARHSHALAPQGQAAISFHFSCADDPFTHEGVTVHWLLGHAMARGFVADRHEGNATHLREDELNAYDELTQRFGDDEAPAVREQVARGLFNKGVVLGRLGRDEDALATYEDMAQRFGDDEAPAVREHVASGFYNKATALSRRWRHTGERVFLDQAIAAGRQSIALGGEAYNLACVLALAAEYDEALEVLAACLRDKEIKWAEVKGDPDWADVRNDPRYSALEKEYGGEEGHEPDEPANVPR